MSIVSSLVALLAVAVKVQGIDPRDTRIAELEAGIAALTAANARLVAERDALQEEANSFGKRHAQEKARADAAGTCYQRAEARIAALLDLLSIYEGRCQHPTMSHLCCVPARHDFIASAFELLHDREIVRRDLPG